MDAEKTISQLLGDFYEAHTTGNEEDRRYALGLIEARIDEGKANGNELLTYYNDMLSGRSGFNAKLNISDYPKESIIRELFQNALGCRYASDDIKIVADFKENDVITVSYNEMGFSTEDILYYLGFGMNNGDTTREGRFGIGAKSVFLNVNALEVKSNSFSFRIENNGGNLSITDLETNGKVFNGTKITLYVDHDQYERILDNFITLTDKKGDYLNLVELCFAFNRKKVLNPEVSSEENTSRTINLAVAQNSKVTNLYRVMLHKKDENDVPKIRFYHNNKSLADFLCYENEGFVYLIPFAVSNAKRDKMIGLLLDKYNYFSTYELTGYIGGSKDKFIDEKLSAFFVSVPNSFITYSRTGIRYDKEEAVYMALERDIPEILKAYGKYFVLDLKPAKAEGLYCLMPRSYAFEFFNSYLKTSRYADRVREIFISGISVNFPNEKVPVPYNDIRGKGFKALTRHIPFTYKNDGSADAEYVDARLEKLRGGLSDIENKTLYAGYEWENQDGSFGGRVYRYEFYRGENVYPVSSAKECGSDFDLYVGFPSIIGYYLPTLLEDECVMSENDLEKILALFDDAAGEDYSLAMKYYRLHFERDTEKYFFELSKIKIGNLKNAMETIEKRSKHFISHQNYNEVVSLLINSFTEGRDTIDFLKDIKEQGGVVSLALDINKKFRFQAYGKQFMIPSKITNQQLLDILGDPSVMLESGVLKNRKFDFPYVKSRYSYDRNTISQLLIDYSSPQETKDILDTIGMCNMKYDGVIFLTEDDKIVCSKHYGAPISEEEREAASHCVILRDDLSKTEFASLLEYVVAGGDRGILNRHFNRSKDPNRIIPDQIPLKYRRAPVLTKEEFDYVKELYASIREQNSLPNYKSYFAKDINDRLYGFGCRCGVCGEQGENLSAYDLVNFGIDVMTDGSEKRFSFAMFLCRNHMADSDGWLIKELTIGGLTPFKWLDACSRAEQITPEFFMCSMKYIPHLVYDITPEASPRSYDVVAGEMKSLDFRITPLMAAKWAVDNSE